MEDSDTPPTQPFGALVPPRKVPGTAIATATPDPPQNRHSRMPSVRTNTFRRALERTLDAVDEFADNVAAGLGLRSR